MRRLPGEQYKPSECRAIIEQMAQYGRGWTAERNTALVQLYLDAGLRWSEGTDLQLEDLHLDEGYLVVRRGKGGKRRLVAISPETCRILASWLIRRDQLKLAPPLVFPTASGRRLPDNYFRRVLPRVATKAGLAKRLHTHGFRHTHARDLADAGVPVHMIQADLGHASLRTTQVYLEEKCPQKRLAVTSLAQRSHLAVRQET